jgi:hypothetical protein
MTCMTQITILCCCLLLLVGCSGAQGEEPRTGPAGADADAAPAPEAAVQLPLVLDAPAEDDPFSGGALSLAVKEMEVTRSLRPKLDLRKLRPDEVLARVSAVDDRGFPRCVVTARVTRAARSGKRQHRLIGRGKAYRFAPATQIKLEDLADAATRSAVGLCYYPVGTPLALEVVGVDRRGKAFEVAGVRGAW